MAVVPLHGGLPVPSAAVVIAAQARVSAGPYGALTQRLPTPPPPPPVMIRSRQTQKQAASRLCSGLPLRSYHTAMEAARVCCRFRHNCICSAQQSVGHSQGKAPEGAQQKLTMISSRSCTAALLSQQVAAMEHMRHRCALLCVVPGCMFLCMPLEAESYARCTFGSSGGGHQSTCSHESTLNGYISFAPQDNGIPFCVTCTSCINRALLLCRVCGFSQACTSAADVNARQCNQPAETPPQPIFALPCAVLFLLLAA